MEKNKKVLVGMSGGVDSSVAALLLKRDGFDVAGAFMKLRDGLEKEEEGVRKIAKSLNIPFYVFDFKESFKEKVSAKFIEQSKSGVTPNPCVECNREIKFGLFLKKALSLGFDFVATGHYIRLRRKTQNPKPKTQKKEYSILRGKDKAKDQSYFLWRIKKDNLEKLIFPLGELTKEEVKEIAKKGKIKKLILNDSQEICFAPEGVGDFLKKELGFVPGKILDEEGTNLREHKGLFFYTIGQRKGLGLAGGPYFVLEKKLEDNTLIVTKEEKKLEKKEVFYSDANFFTQTSFPRKIQAKIRYAGDLREAFLEEGKVTFLSPVRAVAPGQSVVFYEGERVIGGGIIKREA